MFPSYTNFFSCLSLSYQCEITNSFFKSLNHVSLLWRGESVTWSSMKWNLLALLLLCFMRLRYSATIGESCRRLHFSMLTAGFYIYFSWSMSAERRKMPRSERLLVYLDRLDRLYGETKGLLLQRPRIY